MAAWQKWWVTLLFLIPALIAGSGILLWYFQSEAAARHLRASLHHTIANDLKQQFNIDLRKLRVKLTPYDHQQKVAIV